MAAIQNQCLWILSVDTADVLLVVYVQVTKLMMTKFSLFFDAVKPVFINVLLEGSQNGQIVRCDDVKINEMHAHELLIIILKIRIVFRMDS